MGGADNVAMENDPSPLYVRVMVESCCAVGAALTVSPIISIVGSL